MSADKPPDKREMIAAGLRNLGYRPGVAATAAAMLPDTDRPLADLMRDALRYAADPGATTAKPAPVAAKPAPAPAPAKLARIPPTNPPRPAPAPAPVARTRPETPNLDALIANAQAAEKRRDAGDRERERERAEALNRRAEKRVGPVALKRRDPVPLHPGVAMKPGVDMTERNRRETAAAMRSGQRFTRFQLTATGIGLGLSLAVAWFAAALSRRAEAGDVSPTTPKPTTPKPTPSAAPASPGRHVKVVLPRPMWGLNANLRASPWGAIVAGVVPGTDVEIMGSAMAPEKNKPSEERRWYQVRTTDANGVTVVGWLHSDLLPGA